MNNVAPDGVDPHVEAVWRKVLTGGHHHRLAFLPGGTRCFICHVPMDGFTGKLVDLTTGIRPSRKHPQMCNLCDDAMPSGGAEVDLGVLFADVRGSTGLAEQLGPTAFAQLLNRFYRAASESLFPLGAVIDKMVGDEVVALFLPNVNGTRPDQLVLAARRLMAACGYRDGAAGWIPVGIGLHHGPAYCGRIGAAGAHDFTALGDTVNTGARLQGLAAAGEIVMGAAVYRAVEADLPGLPVRTVELRGRAEPVEVRTLRLGA